MRKSNYNAVDKSYERTMDIKREAKSSIPAVSSSRRAVDKYGNAVIWPGTNTFLLPDIG